MQKGTARILYVGAGVVIVIGLYLVLRPTEPEASPELASEPSQIEHGAPEVLDNSAPEADSVAPEADDSSEEPEAIGYDPSALAELIYDGGMPADVPAYDPEPRAPSVARLTPRVTIRGPDTPERRLSRARFWQGMVQRRVEAMQAQLEAARERGDTAAEARATRQIERLEAQRPGLQRRVEELSADVPAGDFAGGRE